MRRIKVFYSQKGMTLIELTVALAIVGLLSTAALKTFYVQNNNFLDQEQIVEMQQNLRSGFDLMTREVRMAGFNPTDAVGIGWVEAKPSKIVFSVDHNENGAVTSEQDEYISYELFSNSGSISLGRKAVSTDLNYRAVADNISALGFAYAFDSTGDGLLETDAGQTIWAVQNAGNWYDLDVNDDGKITVADDTDNDGTISGEDTGIAVNLADIRAVRIWLLAKTEYPSRDYYEGRSFVVGNRVVAPGDKNRYRLLTAISRCPNTGI